MSKEFSVKTTKTRTCASEYTAQAKRLNNNVTQINGLIGDLRRTGSVYDELANNMKKVSEDLEEMCSTVKFFGTILDSISEQYETTETSVEGIVGTGVAVTALTPSPSKGNGKKSGNGKKKGDGKGGKSDSGKKKKKEGNGGQSGNQSSGSGTNAWLNTSREVGQMYLKNIPTYCTKTTNGSPSKDGRKAYKLHDVGGNLEGQTVYDDCSSFVYACLIQSGAIKPGGTPPCSGQYLPGGSMEAKMKAAGFEWVPCSGMKDGDIQPGDILVKDGHVEVFDHFDSNGKAYSNGWGSVKKEMPASTGKTEAGLRQKYAGVWRYTGK